MTEHKDIDAAILAAQPKFTKPKKSAENTHFKNRYSTLEDDIDAVRSHLHAHGVTYDFTMSSSEFGHAVTTILRHPASGTKRETSVPLIMAKQDMQQLKSATTYARRIGIEFLTGIAPSDDDDAETERTGNSFGAAIQDAWKQSVLDSIPDNASPADRAAAFTDAIIASFDSKTGMKALDNEYSRRRQIIEQLRERFPQNFSRVHDAYEARKIALEPIKHELDVS